VYQESGTYYLSAGEVKLRTKILHNLGSENKCYTVDTHPVCIWTGQYNLIYEDHPHKFVKLVGDARFRSAVAICIRYVYPRAAGVLTTLRYTLL
jgi:hypothetical protein